MQKKALVVIDVQQGIVRAPQIHDADAVLTRIRSLQDRARLAGVPVVHVQHDGPRGHRVEKGSSGWNIEPAVAPSSNEQVIHKRASDAFFETPLLEELRRFGVEQIIVAGCMTQYCVDTTCRRAVTLGLDVVLACDAHTTADEGQLLAEQIIGHHNTLLDGFTAADHSITVKPSSKIDL
jgi:nicotinamidase-related amidase